MRKKNMKKLSLLSLFLMVTFCQHSVAVEPVGTGLRSLGRFTGWGWAYQGYHQTSSACPNGPISRIDASRKTSQLSPTKTSPTVNSSLGTQHPTTGTHWPNPHWPSEGFFSGGYQASWTNGRWPEYPEQSVSQSRLLQPQR
jgi:hypothetical protein